MPPEDAPRLELGHSGSLAAATMEDEARMRRPRSSRAEVSLDPSLTAVDELRVFSWPGFNRPRRRFSFGAKLGLGCFVGIALLFAIAAVVNE